MTRLRAVIGRVHGGTIRPLGILHPSTCPVCRRRPVLVGETSCWPCRDQASFGARDHAHTELIDRFSNEGGDPYE